MANKITKLNDTELEVEEESNKYVLTKEHIEKRLQLAKDSVIRCEDLLKKFD